MTRRLKDHPELGDNETLLHACYGLGAAIVKLSNRIASPHLDTWDTPETSDGGLAAPVTRSGVFALTNQRLLFFAKRFSIGTPKHITAAWPLTQIEAVRFTEDDLMIVFVDGSQASLHVPPMQKPKRFVECFDSIQDNERTSLNNVTLDKRFS